MCGRRQAAVKRGRRGRCGRFTRLPRRERDRPLAIYESEAKGRGVMAETPSGSSEVKGLGEYRWLSFDVVGTLIDFEAGIVGAVREIATA